MSAVPQHATSPSTSPPTSTSTVVSQSAGAASSAAPGIADRTAPPLAAVPQPSAGTSVGTGTSVHVVTRVDDETTQRYWALYQSTFGPLAVAAVNRHLLHKSEFMEVMEDERVDKYLVRDDLTGEALAMCTLTNHLETVTWVSAEYFAHHYPEHAARNGVYYLGFSLVGATRRRAQLFTQLITRVSRTLVAENAMCAYDICQHNNETIGLGNAVGAMIQSVAPIDVRAVDTQTYYAAVPVASVGTEVFQRLPGQRITV